MSALDAVYRTRQLFLVRCDCRNTKWYRAGQPPPCPPAPADLKFEWLGESDWPVRASAIVCEPSLAQQRLRDGGRCLVATDPAGQTAYEIWIMPAPTWTDWIKAEVGPPPGYALFAGAWTRQDQRGRNVHIVGIRLGMGEACRMGRPGVYAGIEGHEVLPHARRNVASGLYEYASDGILEMHELCGRLRWHRRLPAPRELERALAELAVTHKDQFAP